jgi:hypothetical protein
MKIPKIPGLPWWAQVGLQVGSLITVYALTEIVEAHKRRLFNASVKQTNDEDDAVEGEWWSS